MLRLLKALRTRRKAKSSKAAAQAAAVLAPKPEFLPELPTVLAPTPQIVERLQKAQSTTIGMQGYAPIVKISVNRRYCEYCAERVVAKSRHVCWGNAEHQLHTLSDDERSRILEQLARKPRKLTRVQLRKLYKADRLGLAIIDGERYGE